MVEERADLQGDASCNCESPDARYQQFRSWRILPCDDTDGRFGDVSILECIDCRQLWLRYAVEYEGFSNSGRWARGKIEDARARGIRSGEAVDFLAGLPSYLYGGSRFGKAGTGSGAMNWGT